MADDRRWSDGLLESGFGSPRAAAALDWRARIGRMLDVEVALARTQATLGLIPGEAADAIERACQVDRVDLDRLAEAAAAAPTPVIPLLRHIRDAADDDAEAVVASYLHQGATSQDVIDTAMVLQLREVLALLEAELVAVGHALAELAVAHRGTIQPGRTLGQQAVPITFGLVAARWLGAIDRRVEQLRSVGPRVIVLQLGGAAGTLGVHDDRGVDLAEAMGRELGLPVPPLPWHAERDRIAELAGALGGVVSVVDGIASDIVRSSMTEIGELREAGSAGQGSSAMPHKSNPVHATAVRAAARLARGELSVLTAGDAHEHERAAGAWQAEWVAVPGALVRTLGAVERLHRSVLHLDVDAERARHNLDVGLGLTATEALAAALSPAVGRAAAQALVGELAATAATQGRPLADVTAADARVTDVLTRDELDRALDPATSLRNVDALIDRALDEHRTVAEAAR